VPAHDAIELLVLKRQRQGIAGLKTYARAEPGAARTRALEMLFLEVDADQRRFRVFRGETLRDSPVPQPTSSTAPLPTGWRSKIGSSCGQIASACAARLRTIDSSAISFACELLGCIDDETRPVGKTFAGRGCQSAPAHVTKCNA